MLCGKPVTHTLSCHQLYYATVVLNDVSIIFEDHSGTAGQPNWYAMHHPQTTEPPPPLQCIIPKPLNPLLPCNASIPTPLPLQEACHPESGNKRNSMTFLVHYLVQPAEATKDLMVLQQGTTNNRSVETPVRPTSSASAYAPQQGLCHSLQSQCIHSSPHRTGLQSEHNVVV